MTTFVLRPAAIDDCEFTYRLSMEPEVRANSVRPDEFTFAQHADWFAKKLSDPDVRFWVASEGDVPFGQVRYQKIVYGKELWTGGPVATPPFGWRAAEVSISIAAAFRGRGWGRTLLDITSRWAGPALDVDSIVALILPGNAASVRTFVSAGYVWAGEERRMDRNLQRYERKVR